MKQNIMKALLIALVAFPLSTMFAQRMKGPGTIRGMGRKMIEQLNLTDSQKDQIAKFRLDNQKNVIDMKSEIAKIRLEIKEQMMQKEPDENKIIDLAKKVSSIQAEMKSASISTWFKTYRILDDKQKEVFKKLAPMLKERAKSMRGKGLGRWRNQD